MDKILSSLLIAAAVSSLVVFSENTQRTAMEDGKRRVEFALHGRTSCALVDGKIFCAPAVTRAPIKLASTVSR